MSEKKDEILNDLKKLVQTYGDGYIFDEPDNDTEQTDISKPWRHVSGKLAREIAKKYKIEVSNDF